MQNNTRAILGCAEAHNNTKAIQSCKKPNWIDIKCKLKESLKFKYWDAIRENSLLFFLYGLLYLAFNNVCHKDYNGQIKQCL